MNREKRLRIHPVVRQMARENRRPMTETEESLWPRIRGSRLRQWKFRRQHPIGRFIADFYCAEVKLVVEIDGASHEMTASYDTERTIWLNQHGYTVIRFTNEQVLASTADVLAAIDSKCTELRNSTGRID
jgi:very-short-patch-repair endonuclease